MDAQPSSSYAEDKRENQINVCKTNLTALKLKSN